MEKKKKRRIEEKRGREFNIIDKCGFHPIFNIKNHTIFRIFFV
jgi:hypothetical protein